MISLVFHGHPQPGGSKRAVGRGKFTSIIDANPKAATWKESAAWQARQQYRGDPLTGPLRVRFTFYRARPKGHFRTGRHSESLRPSAPRYPATKPDATKLVRALEDALTGVVWQDDARIVEQTAVKTWGIPGALVEVEELEP